MNDSPAISAQDFGPAFKGFLEQAVTSAPVADPFFLARLREHFGTDTTTLPIVAEQLAAHEHANLQVALDAWTDGGTRTTSLLGVNSEQKRGMGLAIADLVRPARPGLYGGGVPVEGPVDYVNLGIGDDRVLACVQFGLYLLRDGDEPLAALVRGPDQRGYQGQNVAVEVMGRERQVAEAFLAELRTSMRKRNLYRGRVVSLSLKPPMNTTHVNFHHLPVIDRDDIVLPAGILERVERHAVGWPATPSGCGRPVVTSSGACCSTARRERERR